MPTTRDMSKTAAGQHLVWTPDAIEKRSIASLRAYENAARNHPEAKLRRLADAIAAFGFVVPVLVDGDGSIIAGHARVEAARRLGMDHVPAIRADHLDAAATRALRIADNRLTELSDWNEAALRIELGDLIDLDLAGGLDFDVTITGFETPEIDIILGGAGVAETQEQESAPEPDRLHPPVTQVGDLWALGTHRIFCGDALAAVSYDDLLAGESVDMIFTDPPYNVPIQGHVRSGGAARHREFAMASGEMSDAEFRAFLASFLARAESGLRPGAVVMICMDWRHIEPLIAVATAAEFEMLNLCVWNKTNGGMGSLYRSKHELIGVFRRPGAAHVNNVELGRHGRNRTNVWDYAGVNSFGAGRAADLADHPTVKPTALVADAILDVSRQGDVVLDPFGGSGATLLGAERTGRRARLIELDPAYVDVAIRRWQEMTGQEAVQAQSGERFAERAERQASSRAKEMADVRI